MIYLIVVKEIYGFLYFIDLNFKKLSLYNEGIKTQTFESSSDKFDLQKKISFCI